MSTPAAPSANENIKDKSNFLRGTIVEGLADRITGSLSPDDTQLTKFHGFYQQDDRDLRLERQRQKLEPLYSFMLRLRIPGGVATPAQYLKLDQIAQTYANHTLRLTTRQTFQYHGVIKRDLKATMQAINAAALDTLAACGDVNRNVLCGVNPHLSAAHGEVYEWTKRISEHLLPRTRAYHEIWLDGEKVAGGDEEPIYGKHYLPRKFKAALAIPPSNDVDIFSNDLGFIAILEKGKLVGFNVTVGGGLGMTHGDLKTYPRLAGVMGFCTPDQVLKVAEHVVTTQRDHGDRTNRKHARLKYTIDDKGIDWFRGEVESRCGFKLQAARPFTFTDNGDRYGWVEGHDGRKHLTLFVQNGRIKDTTEYRLMTALREIAKVHQGEFWMTPNQNITIAGITPGTLREIESLARTFRLTDSYNASALRLNSMACVAFPTCGLAMAESERYLPSLIDKLDLVLDAAGLRHDPITIRMTGCPNGCARPYLAEIAMVGKSLGKYNLYLGASFNGDRLNKLYKEQVDEAEILDALTPLIHRYAKDRNKGEHFGDFVIRTGVIKATREGKDFHA
jgi:sulfite reductase (NADPH) hemoprotein beta-component